MNEIQRKTLKNKIIEEFEALQREISELEQMLEPITPECAVDDVARTDLMNEQEISARTLYDAKIRRNRLEYALRKIDTPEYGICMECEEEIPYERLIILPEATHCIRCASNL